MVLPLRWVLVLSPDQRFGEADPERWHYLRRPRLDAARREHDGLVKLLRSAGARVEFDAAPGSSSADAIYTHDPAVVTDSGAILLNMGKPERRDEPAAMGRRLEQLGIPILHRLEDPARAEGGDLLWLDGSTLAVGLGSRTNPSGLEELGRVLRPLGVEVLPVELPTPEDPRACLHLMSFISLVDHGLAVVHRPLLPEPFARELERRGIGCVDAEPSWRSPPATV
jgi:N-dimethylarginine dimethylaminohydrolase